MSTLEMRAAQLPKAKHGGFARFIAALRDVLDAFDEARRQAYEAERRYPYMS
jgi:hypothetical protein